MKIKRTSKRKYKEELEKNRKEVKDMMKSVKFRKRISRLLRDVFELEDEESNDN